MKGKECKFQAEIEALRSLVCLLSRTTMQQHCYYLAERTRNAEYMESNHDAAVIASSTLVRLALFSFLDFFFRHYTVCETLSVLYAPRYLRTITMVCARAPLCAICPLYRRRRAARRTTPPTARKRTVAVTETTHVLFSERKRFSSHCLEEFD